LQEDQDAAVQQPPPADVEVQVQEIPAIFGRNRVRGLEKAAQA